VELGAFDGKEESNSMFFDRCLGWQGLLIEAQSQSYQKVIENRPHAIKLSFSPTCRNEHEVEKFYDYPLSNNGVEGLAKSYTGKETVEVPCGSLTPVLLDIFGPKISFFSLDVEGAELKVLETLDFTVLSIEVIMVEIQNSHCPEANCIGVHHIRRHMSITGKYALFVGFLEASDVYVLRTSPAWGRAMHIQNTQKQQMQSEMHDRMMVQRQQFTG
jgi:FkbM family methyltransferase